MADNIEGKKSKKWTPEKPGSLMTDVELMATPIFRFVQKDPVYSELVEKRAEQKRLARTMVDNVYHRMIQKRAAPIVAIFLEELRAAGVEISSHGLKVFPDGKVRMIVGAKKVKKEESTHKRPGRPPSLRKTG